MALVKTTEEIAKMRRGGALLTQALAKAVQAVKPGVAIKDLDTIFEASILAGGGKPSFKNYQPSVHDTPFPTALCISINEEVVHGPGNRPIKLKEGDIVGLDAGCWYEGLCTDMAVTVPVGKILPQHEKLLLVTRAALLAGVKAAKVGGLISDIGRAIENYIKPHGYGIVRALVGHGVGHAVHEAPHVPNYYDGSYPKVKIKDGMCLALEPMVGEGDWTVETADDGWTVRMADGKFSAHFEVTIAVTKESVEILTPLPV